MTESDAVLQDDMYDTALAIVGMSGRFPGANDVPGLWKNLVEGVISIKTFADQELLDAGIDPELVSNPQYVKAGTELDGITDFDASFFGYTPREAQCLDPQHRLFLECSWEALEQAGYPPDSYAGLIGVFAGSRPSEYRDQNLSSQRQHMGELVSKLQVSIGNDADALASTVSYKMNLKGPGVSVQTYCSTSLVATHLACQSLLTYDCDLALAGGAALALPQPTGYMYEEGGILSQDGQCRTFDAQSQGSVIGSGVGVVVIKRLKDALEAHDHIYSVIRGSASNNDGSVRVGYTAPGVNGQSAVIANAISQSGVSFDSIGYIEAHGTGTKLGDAIELAALLRAFGPETSERQYCALGSVKPNIGHLDRASGVTGLIKTTLALYNRQLPPSLNFEKTSPDIDLEHSPFFVNTRLREWETGSAGVRRAGVNSFGLGGTNAHVVLEEAPHQAAMRPGRDWKVLPLAARSPEALEQMTQRLYEHLLAHEEFDLLDVAYTLQVGRTPFHHRQTFVCRDRTEALAILKAAPQQSSTHQSSAQRRVTLLFPECGNTFSASEDLLAEPRIREALQHGAAFIEQQFHCSVEELLKHTADPAQRRVGYLLWTYALTHVLQHWGIKPGVVLGQGAGSIVAVIVAGIISLEDGLKLALADTTDEKTLIQLLEQSQLHAPQIPVASALQKGWLSDKQALSAHELARHLSAATVSPEALLDDHESILLEMGDGQHWIEQLKAHTANSVKQPQRLLSFWSSDKQDEMGQEALLTTIGKLWEHGAPVKWEEFSAQEQRGRVPLPTYPFERQRFWIELRTSKANKQIAASPIASETKLSRDNWFYKPTWQQVPLVQPDRPALAQGYLVMLDAHNVGEQLARKLELRGARVTRVQPEIQGDTALEKLDERTFAIDGMQKQAYQQLDERTFTIDGMQKQAYQQLFEQLSEQGTLPDHIIHCSSLIVAGEIAAGAAGFQAIQERGLYNMLFLLQAFEQQTAGASLHLTVLTNNVQTVTGQEQLWPEKSPLLGLCKVASQENPDVLCRSIDLEQLPETDQTFEQLLLEILSKDVERTVAYRQEQRWIETYLAKTILAPETLPFREHGIYLITGGLGGVGLLLATYLAQQVQARLALVGRSAMPAREEWSDWLANHESDDANYRRIKQIQIIEALGSEVLILQADVANTAQLNAAFEQVEATFGGLHGVIHAAGISNDGAFSSVQELEQRLCDWHFGPKVQGLYALEQALQDRPLDFCILFSSLSTILGGLGLSAYTAANRFMDAFAANYNRQAKYPWICINWDSWQVKERPHGDLGATIAAFTMSPEEGADAFTRALISGETHLVNSTGDLDARLRQWIYLDSLDGNSSQQGKNAGPAPIPSDYERILSDIWKQTLGIEQVELSDNFFDLGGNSLTALQLISRIRKTLQIQLPAIAIFEAPTISTMVQYLRPTVEEEEPEQNVLAERRAQARQGLRQSDIAIIGMSGRFPGASSVEQFWQNLHDGVESLTVFTEEELLASGLDPELINDPAYVRARPILKTEEVETFDAAFFGYSPREAELTDPQQRLFLECTWEALEHAGYDAERYQGLIGMFGGTNISSYMLELAKHPEVLEGVLDYQLVIGNDKDSLATNIAYKMNLRGPSLTVQTFCSTSMVATHLACQSLLNGESDIAMAGGVSIRLPSKAGYLYQEGGQESVDGHCYTFDARATGSTFGDGAAVVVLKRLSDALADGDTIHAVIKGSAINNDGSLKVSYTAPSVNGQAEVVMRALTHADISPESISYVEAHGTATELGDPIEVASLTKAYRSLTQRNNFCAIGSVKTNVGHMDRASGVSGLIKVIESLKHQEIPASLNFSSPNDAIDFANSPFYVNTSLTPWPRYNGPRRAGVNSLGMGGTNVHVIVEEAPEPVRSDPSRPYQLLLLSARTTTALEASGNRLSAYLQSHSAVPLADIAHTLQVGRKQMEQRTMIVSTSHEDALTQLANPLFIQHEKRTDRPVAFLFAGVGEQYEGMAGDLYTQEPVFRECIERCCTFIQQRFQLELLPIFTKVPEQSAKQDLDLRAMLGRSSSSQTTRITDPIQAQCSTFILEYALTRLLHSWGVRPQALLGYSLGEYMAATIAGVFTLEDALSLVVQRAQLVATLPTAGMLAVYAAAEQVQPLLVSEEGVDLAILTSPGACILSGPEEALEIVARRLQDNEIVNRRIASDHAFHTSAMAPIREQLTALIEALPRRMPTIPYLSNVSGDWITSEQVQDANYWGQHLCEPVRFSQCVSQLLGEKEWLLLEVGVGQMLSGAVKQHQMIEQKRQVTVIATMSSIYEHRSAQETLLRSLGQLWLNGARIDWSGFTAREHRQRIPLPTYPFERQRYWLSAGTGATKSPTISAERAIAGEMAKIEDPADWFFSPSWQQAPRAKSSGEAQVTTSPENWLLFMDTAGVGKRLAADLQARGYSVVKVNSADSYQQQDATSFQIRPSERDDYQILLQALSRQGTLPTRIAHLWLVNTDEQAMADEYLSEHGFYSLLALAQALGSRGSTQFQIDVISSDMQDVTGNENLIPTKSLAIGPCKVIQQEYGHIRCRSIDLAQSELSIRQSDALLKELLTPLDDAYVALRGRHRWIQTYEPLRLEESQAQDIPFRSAGVYMIIGGLGGVGLALAEHLARSYQARLVLVGRSGLPPRDTWDQHLQTEGSELGRRIRQIQVLEDLGTQIIVAKADLANEDEMRSVMQQTQEVFGDLNGVIHAAALPPGGLIQLKTPAQAAAVLAPKVQGTMVLEKLLVGSQLDFLIFFSSMSSSTGGGPGQVDYCAANAFLDAFAHRHSSDYGMTISINWGEWLWDAWAAGLEGFPPEVRHYFIEKRRDYGISFEEGMEALERIMARRLTQIVVATQDFPRMVEGSRTFSIDAILGAVTQLRKLHSTAYPRPNLSTPYLAPETELEKGIIEIWGELLGIEQIGINDNFFELGGHSLIGAQLIARLRQSFQVNLSLEIIFEAVTVAELAAAIELSFIEEIEQRDLTTVG